MHSVIYDMLRIEITFWVGLRDKAKLALVFDILLEVYNLHFFTLGVVYKMYCPGKRNMVFKSNYCHLVKCYQDVRNPI